MERIISEIHASSYKAVLAITGGGADAIGSLLRYGGGSATVLDAQVPYCTNAFEQFARGKPDKFCSLEAARILAVAAFQRAKTLAPEESVDSLVGIGASCSLSKGPDERAGREHHVFVAAQTSSKSCANSFTTIPGLTRISEEALAAGEIIWLLATICGVNDDHEHKLSSFWAKTEKSVAHPENDLIRRLFNGLSDSTSVLLGPAATERPEVLFPGAFNPLHKSHIEVAEIAHRLTKKPVDFEISIKNVDKPPLDYFAINGRIDQIRRQVPSNPAIGQLWLTNAPKFIDKFKLWPGVKFVVGYDTLRRLGDCKYYPNARAKLEQWDSMYEAGTRFLVFTRKGHDVDGVHPELKSLCEFVPSDLYDDKDGVSSSQIRKTAST